MNCKCEGICGEDHNPCGVKVSFYDSAQYDDHESHRCCWDCQDRIIEQTKKDVLKLMKDFGK